MLERAYMSLPKESLTKERFQMPAVDSMIQGSKTLVRNFDQLLKAMERTEEHVCKFLTKEFGTAVSPDKGKLVLNGKFGLIQVTHAFESYLKQYVLCHECGKPDTHIMGEHGVKMLKCQACGAMSPVRKL